MSKAKLPTWVLAFGDTLFMPFVLLLLGASGFGLLFLTMGVVALVAIREFFPIVAGFWFVLAFVLGFVNLGICFRWLSDAPDYRGLAWYFANSTLILLTFSWVVL